MQQSMILAIVFDSSSSHLALELEINHSRNDGMFSGEIVRVIPDKRGSPSSDNPKEMLINPGSHCDRPPAIRIYRQGMSSTLSYVASMPHLL